MPAPSRSRVHDAFEASSRPLRNKRRNKTSRASAVVCAFADVAERAGAGDRAAAGSLVPMPAPPGNPSFYVDPSKLGNFGNSFSGLSFFPLNSISYIRLLKVIIG